MNVFKLKSHNQERRIKGQGRCYTKPDLVGTDSIEPFLMPCLFVWFYPYKFIFYVQTTRIKINMMSLLEIFMQFDND